MKAHIKVPSHWVSFDAETRRDFLAAELRALARLVDRDEVTTTARRDRNGNTTAIEITAR